MARAKKEGTYFNCKISQPEYEGLLKLSEETGLERTTIIERAIKLYIQMSHGYSVNQDGTIHFNKTFDEFLKEEEK